MDSELKKVDWTIDDPPKCEDCTHSRHAYLNSVLVECSRFGTYGMNRPSILRRPHSKDVFGFELCGVEGRGFERKIPDFGEYDFRNNPPTPMQWMDIELISL